MLGAVVQLQLSFFETSSIITHLVNDAVSDRCLIEFCRIDRARSIPTSRPRS